MRRLIVLLVIAFVGAGVYGASSLSSGVSANGAQVSGSTLRAELSAIATTPALQCYLSGLSQATYAPGAGGDSVGASGAAAWANLRLEGLAILRYVQSHFHYRPTSSQLAVATSSLEAELTQAALTNKLTCPGTSTQALAAMPAEMRRAEIQAQAASLYLVSKLNTTVPLTVASMKTYFAAHRSSYDTLCVSVAVVIPSRVAAFTTAQTAGASVASLARQFSVDASRTRGGAYGCYAPTSSSYPSVRADVGSTALNTFPHTPQYVTLSGATYALYVAPTKRTPTTFAQAAGAVLADLRNLNASSANTVKDNILYQASVAIDPALGRWGLSSSGPMVFPPATPSTKDVSAPTILAATTPAVYK